MMFEIVRQAMSKAVNRVRPYPQAEWRIIESNSSQKLMCVMAIQGNRDVKKYFQNSNDDVSG